jgi:hypothetical protein
MKPFFALHRHMSADQLLRKATFWPFNTRLRVSGRLPETLSLVLPLTGFVQPWPLINQICGRLRNQGTLKAFQQQRPGLDQPTLRREMMKSRCSAGTLHLIIFLTFYNVSLPLYFGLMFARAHNR